MGSKVETVGQTGQLIVMCKMVEVLLLLQQLRLNLASDRDVVRGEGQDLVRGEIETVTPDFDVEEASVLAALSDLEGHARVRIPKLSQKGFAVSAVIRKNLGQVEPQELIQREPESPLEREIGIDDPEGLGVGHEDAVGRLLESSPACITGAFRRIPGPANP
jgi:hypothetical protein